MDILIGTGNKGKIIEISEALEGTGAYFVTPVEKGISFTPQEEGNTFAENARQKARFYYENADMPTLADDSGILVEALSNELGIHTRRWGAGPAATDEEWITYFLHRMQQEENKRARFVCTLCFIDNTGQEHFFDGICDGVITQTSEAEYLPGLPISSCFKPDGFDRVYSALTVEEKNHVSHRGKALQAFRAFLLSPQ